MIDLTGRTAIVTGGGRGIGASVASLLGACGANVVVADIGAAIDGTGATAEPAAAVAEQIRADGGRATADMCDVGDSASVTALFERTLREFDRIHVVVNVAGNLRDRMIWNMTEEDWDSVIRVHLKGHFNTVAAAARHWRQVNEPDGNFRLINFTSGAGIWGSPGQPNYGAAKMGIIGLTNSVAQSLPRYGVTANVIAPIAATRMVASIPDEKSPFSDTSRMSPDNVAPIVAYLASVDSAWSNGRIYEASGYTVKVYSYIDALADITSDGPWQLGDLKSKVESTLRPAVEGDPNPLLKMLGQGTQ